MMSEHLSAAVGQGKPNRIEHVRLLQQLLKSQAARNVSTGGGSSHVPSISVQPALVRQNYHDLQLGN